MPAKDHTRDLFPVLDFGRKDVRVSVGDRFGRLVVIGGALGRVGPNGYQVIYFPCRCDCGVEKVVRFRGMKEGTTHSCGCYQRERVRDLNQSHGCHPRPLYDVWISMRQRCTNPRCSVYPAYGGRGIAVCPEWRDDFPTFRDWAVANGYGPRLTIERVDNDGDYEPSNCAWITQRKQADNRRNSQRVAAFAETRTIGEWANDPRCRVSYRTLHYRIRAGWPVEDAMAIPPRPLRISGRVDR